MYISMNYFMQPSKEQQVKRFSVKLKKISTWNFKYILIMQNKKPVKSLRSIKIKN